MVVSGPGTSSIQEEITLQHLRPDIEEATYVDDERHPL